MSCETAVNGQTNRRPGNIMPPLPVVGRGIKIPPANLKVLKIPMY